ncbi:MAG: hypothetical protein HY997_23580 [Mycolicibacterium neoaurum]|nr:hypothetical protein [Mycolicibacterium neoaurum]
MTAPVPAGLGPTRGLTFNGRAFVVAAVVSVVTVVVLFGFLLLGGLLTCLTGAITAAATRDTRRPTTVLSVGLGLLVGPVLYLLLAVVVHLAD